jgi:hypothetical protein
MDSRDAKPIRTKLDNKQRRNSITFEQMPMKGTIIRTRPLSLGRRRFLAMIAATGGTLLTRVPATYAAPDEGAFTMGSFKDLSLRTARSCVSEDWIRPGGPYHEMYTRDAFWIAQALRDTDVSTKAYKRIAGQQYTNGQISTMMFRDGTRERKDDESSILFIIWTYILWKAGVRLSSEPVFKAWAYIDGQAKKGKYITGSGTFHYWLDTLAFGTPDNISYVQGLYALATRCARLMGLESSPAKQTVAEDAYRSLYKPELGTMTLSENTVFLDVSCLVGDYLSFHLLGQPILSPEMVQGTINAFSPVFYPEGDFLGFMVTSTTSGDYLDPSWLPESTDNVYGEYQNGGSWLLYDAMALGAAALHGDPNARVLLLARFRSEIQKDRALHEYLSTHPYSPHYGVGPDFRRDYGWSAFAYLVGEKAGLPNEEPVLA